MVNLTTYKLSLITEKRDIKNYKSMSRETLLGTFDKLEHNLKKISQNVHEQIAEMQNLLQNELNQIIKRQNLWEDELMQISKMRRTKKYKNMSKEELLISFKNRAKHC